MYKFLDYFFALFHFSFILFNLAGWMWGKTRKIHLVSIVLTFISWFGLGIFYGWGYCPCTDWHWKVKRNLGVSNLPDSYIKYYVDKISGLTWNPLVVDVVVLTIGILILALSIYLNLHDYKNRLAKPN